MLLFMTHLRRCVDGGMRNTEMFEWQDRQLLIPKFFLDCSVIFPEEGGVGHHRNMSKCSLAVKVHGVGQIVDSSLLDMCGTKSIVEFVDFYCLVEIRHRHLPTKQQTFWRLKSDDLWKECVPEVYKTVSLKFIRLCPRSLWVRVPEVCKILFLKFMSPGPWIL